MIKSPCIDCEDYKIKAPSCFQNCTILKKLQTMSTILPVSVKVRDDFNHVTNFTQCLISRSSICKPAL